jgi:glycosyltransferase involved in cell wall biosynthesis
MSMHLLVVSHACATAVNRGVYAEIRRRTGWRITLIVPAGWKDEFGNRLDEPDLSGLDAVIQVPVLASGNIILHGYRARLAGLLKRLRPDLIYMNHEPYAVATAQLCRANMRSVRVPFGFYSCQNLRKSYPPPFSWMESMVYRRSSFALPITGEVSEVLAAKGFQGRRTVCALPLDLGKYTPELRGCRPEGFPATGDDVVFGFVGRLTEAKGLRTLAAALGLIAGLPWRLVVVGTGEFQGEFESLLQERGLRSRVHFAGYVPHAETPRWLAAMDVLVLPSETQRNWKEQFGRVIPEAMASGAAVVGSDSGEIPRLIEKSGGGIVFAERDVNDLAKALRVMVVDGEKRATLAAAGRAWVAQNISLEGVAERMIDTFEWAASPEPRSNRC